MTPPRWKTLAKPAIKLALTALVLVAVGRHVAETRRKLVEQGYSLRIDAGWLAAGVALYLVGLCAQGLFFGRVLRSSASPIGYYPALRAYLISHLGKYVPGKAMVVVMRAALAAPYGARPATAALATLYETLVMMAAGGLVAAAGFASRPGPPLPLPRPIGPFEGIPTALLGLGLGLGFLVVVSPLVFPRVAALVSLPFPKVGAEAHPRVPVGLLAEGLAWSVAGWFWLGLSQLAVLRALIPSGIAPGLYPAAIAGVALATVAGFVVPISPGGLGVREWVLWTSLGTAMNESLAVVAALALRLAWVVGELLAASVLMILRPALPRPSAP